MNYSCCVHASDFDTEPSELYDSKIKKARKRHKCDECREFIEPGQKYEWASWKDCMGFCEFKTCLPCMCIRDDLFCSGAVHGVLQESFEYCYGFSYLEVPE
jgi:hypothetical protein